MNLQFKMLYSVVLTRASDYRKDKDSNYHKDKSYYFGIIQYCFHYVHEWRSSLIKPTRQQDL